MAVDERARHELFARLEEEVLGPVPAETLFGYLPPVGWADVATKHDLRVLEERLEARLETMEHRLLSRMDERLAAQARAMTQQTWAILGALLVALVGAMVTTATL